MVKGADGLAAKIEAVSKERSVPELHSQYNITRKKGCGCGFDGAIALRNVVRIVDK